MTSTSHNVTFRASLTSYNTSDMTSKSHFSEYQCIGTMSPLLFDVEGQYGGVLDRLKTNQRLDRDSSPPSRVITHDIGL